MKKEKKEHEIEHRELEGEEGELAAASGGSTEDSYAGAGKSISLSYLFHSPIFTPEETIKARKLSHSD